MRPSTLLWVKRYSLFGVVGLSVAVGLGLLNMQPTWMVTAVAFVAAYTVERIVFRNRELP